MYPDKAPEFDLSNKNNAAFLQSVKQKIARGLTDLASTQLGEPMIYNLVVWIQENLQEFVALSIKENVRKPVAFEAGTYDEQDMEGEQSSTYKEVTKDMSKSQKRRYFDRFGANDDKPRGWNWVDVVSHLSKK